MSSFKVILPKNNTNWSGADFPDNGGSVFGSGNNGQDLWGYSGGAPFQTSDPLQEDNDWYINVTIENPDPSPKEELAFISRYVLANGDTGVFCSMLT